MVLFFCPYHDHHHTTTILRLFFRDHPGEPEPEENFWTLWCKGIFTEADTLTIRLGATLSGLTSAYLHHSPIFFYRPDALPAAQPTASKHRRQLAHSDQGEDARVLLNGVACTVSVPLLPLISCKLVRLFLSLDALCQLLLINMLDKHCQPRNIVI